MEGEIERERKAWWNKRYGSNDVDENGEGVPRFKADRCAIVIEPMWMIEDAKRRDPERVSDLLAKVEQINSYSRVTRVEVVFAEIDRASFG